MSDSLFTIKKFHIDFEEMNVPIYLIPFGDMHRFAPLCDENLWLDFLKWAETKQRCYFLGMGDYDDLMSGSERQKVSAAVLHESTEESLEDLYLHRMNKLIKEIEFMKGRLIGMIEGNHYANLTWGQTSTQHMCKELNCAYLGVSSFIRLALKHKKSGKSGAVDIWAHHGKGGGSTLGSSINTVDKMSAMSSAQICCVSEDTEILSTSGWKTSKQMEVGEKVYSYRNGYIYIDTAKEVIQRPKEPYMYNIKNSNTDQLLSGDHRVYYRYPAAIYMKKNSKEWLVKQIKDMETYKSPIEIPLSGIHISRINLSDSLIRLSAWIISEGSFKSSGIRITQKDEENTREIIEDIRSCGLEWSKQERTDGCNIVYITAKSKKDIKHVIWEKKIPDWVLSCSLDQFEEFFNTLVKGDGNAISKNAGTYYSADKELMDKLQIALTLHGYRSGLRWKKSGFKDGCWMINYCRRQTTMVVLKKRKIEKVKYDKPTWCINTVNKTIICRRNGKVFITGNCMGHDHKKSVATKTRLTLSEGYGSMRLTSKKILLARTGSFLKGYEPGKKSYVAKGMMSPTDLGVVKIELTPKRDCRKVGGLKGDNFYIDIHASI